MDEPNQNISSDEQISIYSLPKENQSAVNEPDNQDYLNPLQIAIPYSSSFKQLFDDYSYLDKVMCGDCQQVLACLPEDSINLIVTSPPYADRRKTSYGGIPPEKYVNWFVEKADSFYRVLQPAGSFILNIKECVVNGERSTYVMELVIELRKHGWYWTEEYLWHKKNSHPGKWPNRFRDNWEHLFHFTKTKKFNMYQENVMVPVGDWAKDRLKNLSETDKRRDNSRVGSGFGKKISNWVGRDMVYPSNVLYMATECYNQQHSATFPVSLPEWFIRLFTKEGDLVLDPFNGSGTTCVAAIHLNRHFLGIDINQDYCKVAIDRLAKERVDLWRGNEAL